MLWIFVAKENHFLITVLRYVSLMAARECVLACGMPALRHCKLDKSYHFDKILLF